MADKDATSDNTPDKQPSTPAQGEMQSQPPETDRTVINPEQESPAPADFPDDDEPHGFGPTFDPSPDPTVIAPDNDQSSQPALHGTVVGNVATAAPAATAKLVEPGTLINNNYRIEELVSAGGMGEVYRAANVYTGDPVAVKVILPELARDQDIIDLFRREARVLVQLRDDAIVSYHNFVLDHGLNRYCLIMEFVEGTHLGSILRRDTQMPDEQAQTLMRRLARGLGQAHARGVTHRDLSPDNVILRHDRVEEAVLIDFGIARSTELGDGLAGRFAGKFKYIAPEQLGHFDGVIGPQTDIYGLALLTTAVLRGKPLEMGDSVVTASDARQKIPDLSGVAHRMFPLLQYMLEPDPANRPQDMAQIIAMLDDPMRIPARYRLPLWAGSTAAPTDDGHTTGISESPFGIPAPAEVVPSAQPRTTKSSRLPTMIAAAVAVALAGGGLYWFMTREPAPADPVDVPQQIAETPTLPPRDPASRDGFLAELSLGPCALAQRVTAGPESGTIAIYSATAIEGAQVQDAYATAFGSRPAITPRHISDAQCPALDFAGALAGRVALPPEIQSETQITATGFQTEANLSGLSGRNLWVALIAPDGAVYDLTAQSSAQDNGDVQVAAAIDVPGAAVSDQNPYLLLAATSTQPLASIAAAPAGAAAATLLPAVLNELQADGEAAAASLSLLNPDFIADAAPEPDQPEP